jgi:uncharacterized BrkB/YihY/UPF0761 family membrane protein
VSIRNGIIIICFRVPLCSCIASLGADQPLLFYFLYSFVPTKKKQKERELFLSTLLKGSVDEFIVFSMYFLLCHVKSHR